MGALNTLQKGVGFSLSFLRFWGSGQPLGALITPSCWMLWGRFSFDFRSNSTDPRDPPPGPAPQLNHEKSASQTTCKASSWQTFFSRPEIVDVRGLCGSGVRAKDKSEAILLKERCTHVWRHSKFTITYLRLCTLTFSATIRSEVMTVFTSSYIPLDPRCRLNRPTDTVMTS